jgi:hypothetical protein
MTQATLVAAFDRTRLNEQQNRVFHACTTPDGAWNTLQEIQGVIFFLYEKRDPEASISARLRDLRKAGLTVERRRRGDPRAGIHEYRVLVPAVLTDEKAWGLVP